MGPLKDIHLSRLGVLVLAVASLAATIVILAGGGASTDAQLAAQTALKHPLRATELVQSLPASVPSSTGVGTRGGAAARSASAAQHPTNAGTASATSSSAAGVRTAPSTTAGPATGNSPEPSPGTGTTASTTATATTATQTNVGLPKVRHVFLLTLDATSYRSVFAGTSKAPYLRHLATSGTVLSGYRTLGAGGLADLLATVSGQPPNADTSSGCRRYVAYAQSATLTAAGVARGKGCVYPDAALTLADQVNASGRTWGAFVAGMGQTNCPVPSTGEALDTPLAGTQAGYDVAHNPFAFFGSLLDAGGCAQYDQDLTHLSGALTKQSRTPSLTVIGGNACVDAVPTLAGGEATTTSGAATTSAANTGASADAAVSTTSGVGVGVTTSVSTGTTTTTSGTGTTTNAASAGVTTNTVGTPTATPSDVPAAVQAPDAYGCPAGQSSGVPAQDAFLRAWVPKILASAAYRASGVLIIAFTGPDGGARDRARVDTGALVLSRWTPRHKRVTGTFDAYSLLHSIEDMLDLQPLAKAAGAPAFAKLVLSR